MGERFGVKCNKCEYKFGVNIGCGLLGLRFFEINERTGKPYYHGYISNQNIIADVDTLIRTAADVREDEDFYYSKNQWRGHGSAQYLCTTCGELHNEFYFRLVYSGGFYEPEYYCSKCSSTLVLVELIKADSGDISIKSKKKVSWKCPLCNNPELVIDYSARVTLYD